MIQLDKNDTILKSVASLLIIYLLFLPIAYDLVAAASLESGNMTIAYFPARVGRYGQRVTVRAHIPDNPQVHKVTLVIQDENDPLRGSMPKLENAGTVPVLVRARTQATVKSGPAPNKKIKGRMQSGDIMHVAGEKNGYYRGVTDSGVKGYVYKNDVAVLNTGHAYAVTLPSSITSRSKLTYHIEATDVHGNTTRTDPVTMRLLTDKEINMFLSMYGGGSATTPGTPLYKKPLFWASMAALAGGAYLLSDSGDENQDQTTVDVLIEWE